MPLESPHHQLVENPKRLPIPSRRGLLAVVLMGVSVGACAGTLGAQGRESASVSERAIDMKSANAKGKWDFMDESHRESAQRIMALPCAMIEREIRASRAGDIPLIFSLIQAASDLQRALEGGEGGEILERSRHFYSLAETMEGGESERKFKELASDPDAEFEVRMFQSYFASAVQDAMNLADIRGE